MRCNMMHCCSKEFQIFYRKFMDGALTDWREGRRPWWPCAKPRWKYGPSEAQRAPPIEWRPKIAASKFLGADDLWDTEFLPGNINQVDPGRLITFKITSKKNQPHVFFKNSSCDVQLSCYLPQPIWPTSEGSKRIRMRIGHDWNPLG